YVTETGVGVVRASPTEPKYIAVQLFARPEATKYSFKITNAAGKAVSYTFNGRTDSVRPRETITHTACLPGTVTFSIGGSYPAANGQVYTLKPTSAGIAVEVTQKR